MFENIMRFFKKFNKNEENETSHSREAAKERLHLVLMQDRANVSADFLELMKQEIIEVIKKYIDVDEGAIDVRLTNKENEDGTNGAPALYANIPIVNIKNEARKTEKKEDKKVQKKEKENKKKTEKLETKENKEESSEEQEQAEPIIEIQNERIAKVILESGNYNQEEKKKDLKEEEKSDVIMDEGEEEIQQTKEEPKSEN